MSSMREMINLMESSISESKMSDIIIDAQQMSKEEFDAHYKGAWDYNEILADYPVEEANESFDPMSEPTKYDSAMDVYQDNGEDALAEYLGMSSQEFDQELTEYCIEHGLHADDDRDMAIHGMVEQMIDDEHQMADMGEPQEMDEERVDEVLPVAAALWAGARIAVPFLVKQGAKIIGRTATVGAKVITKAPVTTVATGTAVAYREELAAITQWAKGAGANVVEIVKAAKQYALPLLAVVAVLYGGKKIHDMITNNDELATENTKDNCTACDKDMADCDCELCDVCDSKGCDNCNDGKVLKVDQTNEDDDFVYAEADASVNEAEFSPLQQAYDKVYQLTDKMGDEALEQMNRYAPKFSDALEKHDDIESIEQNDSANVQDYIKELDDVLFQIGESVNEAEEELNDLRKRAGLDVKEDQDLDYGGHKTLSDIPYEEETEQTDGNISFSQSKSSDKGSVTIEASAENMEELHKVLALAGLEIPSTDVPVEEPSLDVVDVIDTDDEEPQVGDCGDTLSHDDVAYSTDKEVLKNYLQTQLKNRLS